MWTQEYIDKLKTIEGFLSAQDIKQKHLPKYLYKYRYFDPCGFSLKNLEEDTIWLSKPSKLNDPYDSSFDINYEDLTEILGAEFAESEIKLNEFLKNLKDQKNNDFVQILMNLKKDQKKFLTQEFSNKAKDYFQKIFSLSERKDSILMWAHYSKNHTGFCIEYETPYNLWNGKFLRCIHPVTYTDKLFDITKLLNSKNSWKRFMAFIFPPLFKASDWEYEKEWRFLLSYGSLKENAHQAPPVKAVYMGSSIDKNNKELLFTICDRKHIPLYSVNWEAKQFNMSCQLVK